MFHSVPCIVPISEIWVFAYVRQVFAQFAFRNLLSYHFGTVVVAYVRKVFAILFSSCLAYIASRKCCFCLCA